MAGEGTRKVPGGAGVGSKGAFERFGLLEILLYSRMLEWCFRWAEMAPGRCSQDWVLAAEVRSRDSSGSFEILIWVWDPLHLEGWVWPSREGEGLHAWEWWVLWVAARPLGRALEHDEMQSNRLVEKRLPLVWRQAEVLLGRQVCAQPASEPLAWAREMMGQDARS